MNKRILLVEDNPSDVELIHIAFEEVGLWADYTNFRDGDEAIAGDPALGRGQSAAASTTNHPVDRARCLAHGADDYQVKPPHFAELLEMVKRLRDRWLAHPVVQW